jgi:hypothetical protein
MPGSCFTEGGGTFCALDDPAFSTVFPVNADGVRTTWLVARLLTPAGTCSNDFLSLHVPFDPRENNVVTVGSSDFILPTVPETVDCTGVTCDGPSEYCSAEIVVGESGATYANGQCEPYPEECLDNHTCECVFPEIPEGYGCADNGLRGSMTLLKQPE